MSAEKQLKKQRKEEKKLKATLEEQLYSRNSKRFGFDLNPVVSLVTIALVVLLTLYAFISNAGVFGLAPAAEVFNSVTGSIVSNFDWVFILASNFFIVLALYLAFSRLGRIRIGGIGTDPEFSNFAWYSMLISAGMGIGLMFWAVGEPLNHMVSGSPIFPSASDEFSAMATTFLHWGLHPWAIYSILALALAYFAYNKKLPLSLRSIFYPVFKERVFGRLGDVIDIIAVLATLFGLATSLGLGVMQINSGMNFLIRMPISTFFQVFLIILITAIATISIISGIDKGVKFLSKLNMKIAFVFMVLIFIAGPTAYIIRLLTNSFGLYIGELVESSFFLGMGEGADRDFQSAWTVFYLAWWISWSPFVGMFIARVSRGRTIREFILAVLVVPSMLSFVWLSVFGGTAISINTESGGALFQTVAANYEIALFEMIQMLDLGVIQGVVAVILSLIGTLLVMSFFVTSSDSGSIVVNSITSGGKIETPARQRVFWAVLEGFIAAILLIIGGQQALDALQAAVIMSGLPFAIILVAMSFVLLADLQITYRRQKRIHDERRIVKIIEESEILENLD